MSFETSPRFRSSDRPNDDKLSDRGVRHGTCTAGGKAAEARAVTHGSLQRMVSGL